MLLLKNEELKNGIRNIEESINTMIDPNMKYTQYLDDALKYYSKKDLANMSEETKAVINRQEHFSSAFDINDLTGKCAKFMAHINSCPKCRKYVLGNIKGYSGDYMVDILIYALTGAFILFVIDMLLKFK